MKKIIKGFVILAVLSISQDVSAQAYQSAVGARLGTFFSGTYKMFLNESSAIEGIVGFDRTSFGSGIFRVSSTAFVIGGFFEIHNDLNLDGADFQWYYGAGGYVSLGDATGIIPSGIVGLEYNLSDSPINFFIDAIPGLYIGDGFTDFEINGAIGARYILNR